ncbi:hypothetical protein LTR12_003093 [Friedmanniomyces endolithicus]|nr:hypothetical protein LTR12_003093 [Friedmanniomyces endolithicus]
MADTTQQNSNLKQFLASIATIRGDLSNITAPPFVLADKSTTEFPRYWISHPDLFTAPAHQPTPELRLLAVLKWFLASLRGQQYAGRQPSDGVKKPLNAFLGELFLGSCSSSSGEVGGVEAADDECHLVSEQVSHHPPVTACYLWNEKHGVRAEGYTRQEITFNGNINIQQIGHAVMHLDGFGGEDYLIPLPDVKVKGILTFGPYPELVGTYSIVSSTGYVAEVDFTGKGFLGVGGKRNAVHAAIYRQGDSKLRRKEALFTAQGTWSESFEFRDARGEVVDSYDVGAAKSADFHAPPLERQDPWESRRAWRGVIDAIHGGDMRGVAGNKSQLESAQREMRKNPATSEEAWEAVFFRREKDHVVAEKLMAVSGQKLSPQSTCGVWRYNFEKAGKLERPFRGALTPYGK